MLGDVLKAIDAIEPKNPAAKAAVDIALHDWVGKKMGYPWYPSGALTRRKPPSPLLRSVSTPPRWSGRRKEAAEYKVLKVKLGRANDLEMIETIREVTDKPIRVDVNQGWKDRSAALTMIEWLATPLIVHRHHHRRADMFDDIESCAASVRKPDVVTPDVERTPIVD